MGTNSTGSDERAGTGAQAASGPRSAFRWSVRGRELDLSRPVVMGVVNLTPDSFSDGGDLRSLRDALERGSELVEAGAKILDIGGESSRPGARPVPPEEEEERVLPFIRGAREAFGVALSIDTRRARVARKALDHGVHIVNDVSGLKSDPEMASVVARSEAGVVLSHMRGTPATMGEMANYEDLVGEVSSELEESVSLATAAGVGEEKIVLDPGIGFAKTGTHNLTLLRELDVLVARGFPVLVGPSRKRFIGEITGAAPKDRAPGTVAACVVAYMRGARIFRVHDVAMVAQALEVTRAIMERPEDEEGSEEAR